MARGAVITSAPARCNRAADDAAATVRGGAHLYTNFGARRATMVGEGAHRYTCYFVIQTSGANCFSFASFARASASAGNLMRTRKMVPFSVTMRST
jgi:hypothetical protein